MFGGWNLPQHAGRVGGHAAEQELVVRSRVRACWLCCVAVLCCATCQVSGRTRKRLVISSISGERSPWGPGPLFHAWCVQRSSHKPRESVPASGPCNRPHGVRSACVARAGRPLRPLPAAGQRHVSDPSAGSECLLSLPGHAPPTGRAQQHACAPRVCAFPYLSTASVWVLAGCHVTCVCVLGRGGGERGVPLLMSAGHGVVVAR